MTKQSRKVLQTNCIPYHVWSGTLKSGSNYYNRYLQNGVLNGDSYSLTNTYALTVRCVLDLNPADNCNPNIVWSSTPNSSGYSRYYLNSGSFTFSSSYASTLTASVRCVLDLKPKAIFFIHTLYRNKFYILEYFKCRFQITFLHQTLQNFT